MFNELGLSAGNLITLGVLGTGILAQWINLRRNVENTSHTLSQFKQSIGEAFKEVHTRIDKLASVAEVRDAENRLGVRLADIDTRVRERHTDFGDRLKESEMDCSSRLGQQDERIQLQSVELAKVRTQSSERFERLMDDIGQLNSEIGRLRDKVNGAR